MPDGAIKPQFVRIQGLKRYFDVSAPWLVRKIEGRPRQLVRAVDGIDIEIARGETFSLVGESGCGKSTVARLVVGLYPPTAGRIEFDGNDISARRRQGAHSTLRRRLQMIFQDPFASLNPRWRVFDIIAEPIRAFGLSTSKADLEKQVGDLLKQVRLTPADGRKFPHEFSGGQRQRISIARALASRPEFLVCDEPTSALDVSVQAQVLNLMVELQRERALTYLFISHNLVVVRYVSDDVGVMYLGRLVELAPKSELFSAPRHPYTHMLMAAIPDLHMSGRPRSPVLGEVPNPLSPPSGCSFHPRCPFANERCKMERPKALPIESGTVACHGIEEGRIPIEDRIYTARG